MLTIDQKLHQAKAKVKVGDKHFHYKHPENHYKILAIGIIEATEEPCIVYQAEYGEKITWVRTLEDFLSKAKLENGSEVDRFTKLS